MVKRDDGKFCVIEFIRPYSIQRSQLPLVLNFDIFIRSEHRYGQSDRIVEKQNTEFLKMGAS